MATEPKVVRTWDELPVVVFDQGEAFSTRYLERKYRKMEEAMQNFVDRCDRGEVRSRKTYSQFKEILGERLNEAASRERPSDKWISDELPPDDIDVLLFNNGLDEFHIAYRHHGQWWEAGHDQKPLRTHVSHWRYLPGAPS